MPSIPAFFQFGMGDMLIYPFGHGRIIFKDHILNNNPVLLGKPFCRFRGYIGHIDGQPFLFPYRHRRAIFHRGLVIVNNLLQKIVVKFFPAKLVSHGNQLLINFLFDDVSLSTVIK